MVTTVKFSDFLAGNLTVSGNQEVGLSGGVNAKFDKIPQWITSTRPSPPLEGTLGYNSLLKLYEFYNGTAWIQL